MTNSRNFWAVTFLFVLTLTLTACTPAAEEAADTDATQETSTTSPTSAALDVGTATEAAQALAAGIWQAVGNGYQADASYEIPNGETEEVTFTVTVDETMIITGITLESDTTQPISVKQQESFQDNIDAIVVGKNVTEIEAVDTVGTSSLTAGAFFEAIQELQSQLNT